LRTSDETANRMSNGKSS